MQDLGQAEWGNIWSVILGGVIFNASNILLSASTSIAGLSVAFPLGVGLSLVLGVIINYIGAPKGDPVILFIGVARIVVAKAMDLNDFAHPAEGMLTPYSAIFIFSIGVVLSNFIFNTFVMGHPFVGEPVAYKEYFAGSLKTHLVGVLGGAIWCLGTAFSYIASGKAGAAVSYALGQGAPMIAAIWGVFVWKEFKGGSKNVYGLLAVMFLFFVAGLGCIIISWGN